jgi:hypothetical protein
MPQALSEARLRSSKARHEQAHALQETISSRSNAAHAFSRSMASHSLLPAPEFIVYGSAASGLSIGISKLSLSRTAFFILSFSKWTR